MDSINWIQPKTACWYKLDPKNDPYSLVFEKVNILSVNS